MAILINPSAWARKHEKRLSVMGIPTDELAVLRLTQDDAHRLQQRVYELERQLQRVKANRPREMRRKFEAAERIARAGTRMLAGLPGASGELERTIIRYEAVK